MSMTGVGGRVVTTGGMPVDKCIVVIQRGRVLSILSMEGGEQVSVGTATGDTSRLGCLGVNLRVGSWDRGHRWRSSITEGILGTNATGLGGGIGSASVGVRSLGTGTSLGRIEGHSIACGLQSIAMGHGMGVAADGALKFTDELTSL